VVITLQVPGQPETAEQFTLQITENETRWRNACPVCNARPPVWFAYPASQAAMDPAASPIKVGEICAIDLNLLLEDGRVEIASIDPDSF
jgi:hypothetical protein